MCYNYLGWLADFQILFHLTKVWPCKQELHILTVSKQWTELVDVCVTAPQFVCICVIWVLVWKQWSILRFVLQSIWRTTQLPVTGGTDTWMTFHWWWRLSTAISDGLTKRDRAGKRDGAGKRDSDGWADLYTPVNQKTIIWSISMT